MAAQAASDGGRGVPDDAELLRRSGNGDEASFAALVDRHARYLYAIGLSLTGHAADAEDVVQETLAAALTSRFRGESAVRTWLVRILVRQAALVRRKKLRIAGFGTRIEEGKVAGPATGRAADAKMDLAIMLQELSPEHREVIVMRELERMSYDEMAASLGVPRGTVESRLHRARTALRERFKEYLSP